MLRFWWIAILAPTAVAAACSTGGSANDQGTGGSSGDASARGGTTGAAGGSGAGGSGAGGAAGSPPVGPPADIDCGTPTFASGTGLRRHPYLQSVSQTGTRVAWTSTTGGTGTVRYASSPDGPWTEVTATPRMFTTTETDDTEDYTAYDAQLEGLSPNGVYCYEVMEDGEALATGLKFHTAWSHDTRPVRILAFGDSGNASPEQRQLRDVFMGYEHDVFLHLGDMAYGDGTFPEFEERVFDIYRDFMHKVPTFPAPGNHEYNTNSAQPYLDVYYLFEQAIEPVDNERYYSFDYGDVHFVSLDSNEPLTRGIIGELGGNATNTMIDWLRADLAASDATWKVAFFHHPPFTSSERSPNTPLRSFLLPVLQEGGVDVVLCGHDHHYERTVPIRDIAVAPAGDLGAIPYFVIGSGGAGLRVASGDWFTAAVNDQKHIFLNLTINGCIATGEAITLDNEVVDSFTIDGCD